MSKPTVQLHLGDCLEILKSIDLSGVGAVVTDPPYGIARVWKGGGTCGWAKAKEQAGHRNRWDESPPPREVFDLLLGLGVPTVVWGGNYFGLPASRGWLVWDKVVRKFTSGHCELAWTTLDQPIRAFNYSHGQLAAEGKRHPTQKPVPVMEWCLSFLPESCTVIDPFMGSGSTGVACVRTGRNFVGIEMDPGYFAVAQERISDEQSKTPLLDAIEAGPVRHFSLFDEATT